MPLEEEHKSTVSEDNNSPPHLQLKFQKPTVSEYLQQLSFHEKVRDPHTEKLCRVVWDAFVSMSNENRNHLLKGLVERSSENQLDFVRTMLRIEKSGSTLKSNEKWTEGKETSLPFKSTKKQVLSKPSQEMSRLPMIPNTLKSNQKGLSKKSGRSAKSQDQNEVASNLYVRLLNVRYEHNVLIDHLAHAGSENTKTFIKLLSNRCQKIETILTLFNDIVLTGDNQRTLDVIMGSGLDFLNAKQATLYYYEERQNFFSVKTTTWRTDKVRIPMEGILASQCVFNSRLPYSSHNIKKSILDYSDHLLEFYKPVGLECAVTAPIISIEGRILGILEYIDKKSGKPFFNAEDEFILSQLCNFSAIVMSHNLIREESRKKTDDIQAILKTASLMSSALAIKDLIILIMGKAQEILSAERVSLFLVDDEKQQLWTSVANGVAEIRIPINKGIAGHVATTGETLNIPDAYKDPRFNREVDLRTGFVTRNILCMPIRASTGRILGVAQIINKIPDSSIFTANDELMLSAFSALAGATIEKSYLLDKTQMLLDEASAVKNNLSMILKNIADVVVTLDLNGFLSSMNHPQKLNVADKLEMMKTSSYSSWLEGNTQLIQDIQTAFETDESITSFDYELTLNHTKQFVNYTVMRLHSVEQRSTSASKLGTGGEDEIPKPKSLGNGVILVIETISSEKRLMATLGRYMNSKMANELIHENGLLLKGQRVEVTVLMVDLSAFSAITAHLDPKLTVTLLNDHFTHILKAVLLEKGILDKYIGDGAMAVFGHPYQREDDSIRALRAALKMRSGLNLFNSLNKRNGRPTFQMGIGISTGQVLSGYIGSLNRSEYTIIGDSARIANALETVSKLYGCMILTDEKTVENTSTEFLFREIDLINIHKCGKLRVFELVDVVTLDVSSELQASWSFYALGLESYRAQKWPEAIASFNQAVQIANDAPSRYLIERCTKLINGDLRMKESWDGSWDVSI